MQYYNDLKITEAKRLLREDDVELLGYLGDEIVKLTLDDVDCFFVEDGRGAAKNIL